MLTERYKFILDHVKPFFFVVIFVKFFSGAAQKTRNKFKHDNIKKIQPN